MSEINSIANGTFTIGQTSATNFIAGPGIKIDSPSAGTVRIGNDETVLFDNNKVGTSAVELSESRTNFKELKLYVGYNGGYNTSDGAIIIGIPSDTSSSWLHFGFGETGPNAYYAAAKLLWTDDTHFTIPNGTSILKAQSSTAVQGNTAYNNGCRNCITKVVGINRVSGGNE